MPDIEEAAKYLNPKDNTKRRAHPVYERDVEEKRAATERLLDYLSSRGINTEKPDKRENCPDVRPCPFVSCQYHLYLSVTDAGSIKYNFQELDPSELRPSCALDMAEQGGMTLREIGDCVGLTRERIRQIEQEAIDKIADQDVLDKDDLQEALNSNTASDSHTYEALP
ncbi:MAG: sigma factor-like helix-turn-helix DNA-binding protein [Bradymonadaceae bacterium]